MADKITTPTFRLNYASIFKPRLVPNTTDTYKYSICALFDLGADLTALVQQADKALIEKFGAEKAGTIKLLHNYKNPFRNQSELVDKRTLGLKPGAVPGAFFISMGHAAKPKVYSPDLQEMMDQGEIYNGCYARASCEVFAWEHDKGGFGVSFGLLGVQKVADGEPLGGQRAEASDFAPVMNAASIPVQGVAPTHGVAPVQGGVHAHGVAPVVNTAPMHPQTANDIFG